MSKSHKILFNLSGSIAAAKACEVISQLVKLGNEVQVVCTPSTFQFVGRATLEGISGRTVACDLFESGQAMAHIDLARWADLAILCPASASSIAKMANGLGDDLVSTLFLAWEKHKPYLVAPAMNSVMLSNAATQENIEKLKSRGICVLGTAVGALACGEFGYGRMLEPNDILTKIFRMLEPAKSKGNILVTYGGTREPIDSVRFITNFSTGKTGSEMADQFSQLGWNVEVLRAEDSVAPKFVTVASTFSDFISLENQLKQKLDQKEFAAIIHAAAVSDFSVASIEQNGKPAPMENKLSSSHGLTLQLKPNKKILSQLKSYAKPKPLKVIGFKLTNTSNVDERARAAAAVLESGCDLVVHNDLSDVLTRGMNRTFTIFQNKESIHSNVSVGIKDLVQVIDRYLTGETL